jgi:hypothetical protein
MNLLTIKPPFSTETLLVVIIVIFLLVMGTAFFNSEGDDD